MGARRKPTARSRGLVQGWKPPLALRVRAALTHHLACFKDSMRRLVEQPVASLLTVGVIAIALALPTGLFTLVSNLRGLERGWEQLGEVALFLKPGVEAAQARELGEELAAQQGWSGYELITPQQAREDLAGIAGFGDALAALPDNPLPHVLVLRPRGETLDAATLERHEEELEALEPVDFVQIDREWLLRFRSLLDIAEHSVRVLGIVLGLAVLLIVGNTIRLEIQNRRSEIEVTRLLGATDAFLRRPLLYSGFCYGAAGGLAAIALVVLATWLLGAPVGQLADAYNSEFALHAPGWRQTLQCVGIGAMIGWAGAWVAVGRQLARIQPE